MKNIILYSTDCSRCKILKSKLDDKKVEYIICSDKEKMLSMGFKSVPMLEVDGSVLTYLEAINWMKEI